MPSTNEISDQEYTEQAIRENGFLVQDYRDILNTIHENDSEFEVVASPETLDTLTKVAARARGAVFVIDAFKNSPDDLNAVYAEIHQRLMELYYHLPSPSREFVEVLRAANIKLSLHIKE